MKRCDLIFRHAELYDGTGAQPVLGDLAVEGDRIAAVGDLGHWTGDREVVVEGLALAPGFIDAHAHDDRQLLCGAACMTCKLSQGVTTVIIGNCGISLSPVSFRERPPAPLDLLGDESWWTFDSFAEYRERLRLQPPPVNALALIGHMSLRLEAMRMETGRAATDRESARMHDRLRVALAEGAAGLSTGLWYPPSRAAPTQEVLALAEALRPTGGLYVTHLRDEGDRVVESIEEGLGIGREIGCPVIISHHKCTAPQNFGKSAATLALIDAAAQVQSVGLDAYPYAAACTALIPDVVREDIPTRISWSLPHPELTGRMLSDISAEWGCDQQTAAKRLTPAGAIYFSIDEGDVRRILAHPRTVIGSDGLPHDEQPHPRLWGTFPRVLGHYARELGLFDMTTAVHKMTGRTAALFGIADRGELRPGAFADLVLFNPLTVGDRSTFDHPTRPSEGIVECWVNGQSAYRPSTGVADPSAGRLLVREP